MEREEGRILACREKAAALRHEKQNPLIGEQVEGLGCP